MGWQVLLNLQRWVLITTLVKKSNRRPPKMSPFGLDFFGTLPKGIAPKKRRIRASIYVFCPPLLQYIHFALALAYADNGGRTCGFHRVVIHPDDRLLDEGLYSIKEGHESLLQLNDFVRSHAVLGEQRAMLRNKREDRCRWIASCFDQVWMDQRITASASDRRTGDKIDASEFFRASKENHEVALMAIMAGPQICHGITTTAPLAGPDNPVQSSQIYRLEQLDDVDEASLFRWKTTHFCRINSP